MRRLAQGIALVALLASALPAQAARAPGTDLQVFLLTMGPGEHIDARFGHNAIWIHDSVTNVDLVYNYGTFELGADARDLLAFVGRFAMGTPRYWLGVADMPSTIRTYTRDHRNLEQQELELLPAQRADLATRLAVNAREENRYYIYDYYRDNCATRVRDILDAVLGGALRRATVGKPAEGTLRFHTLRSITNDKLLFLGIDAGLGTPVDRHLDQWDEMFLPEKIQERLREMRVPGADGRELPLVKAEGRILEFTDFHIDAAPPHWASLWLLSGGIIAVLILTGRLAGGAGAPGRVVAGLWSLVMGIGGIALLFLWFISHHAATVWNMNLLYFSPLLLLLVFGIKGKPMRRPSRWVAWTALLVLLSVIVGLLMTLIGVQGNQVFAQLTALPTIVLAGTVVEQFIRRRDAAPLLPR